jgi:hypothetical protein
MFMTLGDFFFPSLSLSVLIFNMGITPLSCSEG